MRRARALALSAAGILAATLLIGCKSEPTVAAYVGSERITNAQVESVTSSGGDLIISTDGNVASTSEAHRRDAVLGAEVFLAVARHYAEEKGWPTPSVDYASAA